MTTPRRTVLILMGVLLALAGCRERLAPDALPTAADVNALATALPLTQNAPPPPYDGAITRFASIDSGLSALSGARYVLQVDVQGVFSGTTQPAQANARIEVEADLISSARRVLVSTEGSLIGQAEGSASYEAVRLGPDAFLVRDGACTPLPGAALNTPADLTAGALIGGITQAAPAGRQATLNGEPVYAFQFAPDALVLPAIQPGDDSRVSIDSYELWVAPSRDAVVRFYANLSVENAVVFSIPRPVSGQVLVRYDAYALGQPVNITVPFGC